MPHQVEKKARDAIAKRSREIGSSSSIHGVRSAGPFWIDALETMAHAYREYWRTGVAGGIAADVADLGANGQGFVNPMFAFSSAPAGDYAVHYGTEPLLGFPLAQAFHSQKLSGSRKRADIVKEIVKAAKTALKDWCSSFKKYVDNKHVSVRLIDGDASTLSHELLLELAVDGKHEPRAYIKPWSSRPLLLDGYISPTASPDPNVEAFDVIDTSNLCDHIGLINMLTATTPLLRKNPSAVLYTETLLVASENAHEILSTVLGVDVATFSLMIGLAPVGLLSGVTLEAVANEMAMFTFAQTTGNKRQCRMRIPWRTLESADQLTAQSLDLATQDALQVCYEPQALAESLFNIYTAMFAHENLAKLTEMAKRMTISSYSTDMERYTRAAVVALLRLIKARVVVDWDRTMQILIGMLESDRSLIIGSNSLQELFMHLHCFGLWTSDVLRKGPREVGDISSLTIRSKSNDNGLLAEETVPAIVHLIFAVPRKALRVFTGRSVDVAGTPALHVSVCQTAPAFAYENIFSSFHSFFGQLVMDGPNPGEPIVREDEVGWMGSADLIISCPVPAFGLLIGPRDGIRIFLSIKPSPSTVATFQQDLGLQLRVYETDLNCVEICRDAPKLGSRDFIAAQRRWVEVASSHGKILSRSTVKISTDSATTQLQQHLDFPQDSTENRALANGSVVKVVEASPSTVILHVGDNISRTLYFPFHVQGSLAKIRVARKSSWVEVSVPIHTAPSADSFDSWTQLLLLKGQPPVLWSIPKINLAIQPKIDFRRGADSSWVTTFLGPSVSDSERALGALNQATTSSPMYDLKQSLGTMFASFAGLNPQSPSPLKVFQLTREKSCHTIIFASALRHDLDLGSIVLDAWVVPLTISRVHELRNALRLLVQKQPLGIVLSREESILWKRLLPALAERCRTWSHKSSCEYLLGGAPLSTADEKPSICSCGQGKVPPDFAKEDKEWKPFAKYATQIAIAPIFPVPYVEPYMSEYKSRSSMLKERPSKGDSSGPRCDACGKSDKPLKACARCGKAQYCDQACQKVDWKRHKGDCKAN